MSRWKVWRGVVRNSQNEIVGHRWRTRKAHADPVADGMAQLGYVMNPFSRDYPTWRQAYAHALTRARQEAAEDTWGTAQNPRHRSRPTVTTREPRGTHSASAQQGRNGNRGET